MPDGICTEQQLLAVLVMMWLILLGLYVTSDGNVILGLLASVSAALLGWFGHKGFIPTA